MGNQETIQEKIHIYARTEHSPLILGSVSSVLVSEFFLGLYRMDSSLTASIAEWSRTVVYEPGHTGSISDSSKLF